MGHSQTKEDRRICKLHQEIHEQFSTSTNNMHSKNKKYLLRSHILVQGPEALGVSGLAVQPDLVGILLLVAGVHLEAFPGEVAAVDEALGVVVVVVAAARDEEPLEVAAAVVLQEAEASSWEVHPEEAEGEGAAGQEEVVEEDPQGRWQAMTIGAPHFSGPSWRDRERS